jgi:stage II sporulation protein D
VGVGQAEAMLTVRQGAYNLSDPDSGSEAGSVSAGQKIEIKPSGSGISVTRDGASTASVGTRVLLSAQGFGPDIMAYGNRTYRGSFLVENKNGVLNVINILDVDHYLLGVLPMEMGLSTVPAEALKAQAIVSRTYALKKKNLYSSYDLVSGTIDQVYGGYGNEKMHTTAAVEATKGLAIYFDGSLIESFFSSNSGGYTEDAENVWNEALPYAKAIASPYDAAALGASQDSNGYPGYTYSWQVRYTVAELQDRITQWNRDNPGSPISVGNLQSIFGYPLAYDPATRKITDRQNSSGRITQLVLNGGNGSQSLYRESIRTFLGLRSALFTITPEGGVPVRNGAGAVVMLDRSIRDSMGLTADGQPSEINPGSNSFFVVTADGVVEMNKDQASVVTAYVFDGKGYGHGVGMSQWGAIGMAEAGMNYAQIIEYYYNQNKNDSRLAIMAVQ